MSRDSATGEGMTFWDHLEELRGTLFRILLTVGIGMIGCFFASEWIREFLILPFHRAAGQIGENAGSLVLLKPTEGFVVQLKIALFAGLIATAPVTFYHVWRFVAPGLHQHERGAALPFISVATLLFLVGAAFGYNVLAFATQFFLKFSSTEIANSWSLSAYIGFVTRMVLAFGIVFELPLAIYVLARMGIVDKDTLKRFRRHAAVGILALAAVLTPPDPVSQLTLALPVYLLYEISLIVCHFTLKGKARREEEEERQRKEESSMPVSQSADRADSGADEAAGEDTDTRRG